MTSLAGEIQPSNYSVLDFSRSHWYEKLTCANSPCANPGVKQCARCHNDVYCSRECQVAHYKLHKTFCNRIAASPENVAKYEEACAFYKSGCELHEKAKYSEAISDFRKAIEISVEVLGKNSEFTAFCYRMVGNIMGSMHGYDEALVELRIALQMLKEVLGEEHRQTAIIFDDIGNVFQLKGKPDDALIGYGKALAIRTKLFGENHNITAQSYHNIGLVLFKKNQYKDALESFRKAHAIVKRDFGESDPLTVELARKITFIQCQGNTK
mmetsp:Transcript_20860/g.29747  ORF Transcript_20860/g.29747 Transcript_20860/m.29747 type:complete len:268 (+) Transcript_20860:169-972(+)